MNGYVEAGYLVVTGVLGGYSLQLANKSKKLKRAVVLVRESSSRRTEGRSEN
ncbi:MAG: hypothetical protein HKL83_09320 [Acidimicrobiaceae bacterium]|nr:hypothetical protein [Acidimicrobiaceae bacterium]